MTMPLLDSSHFVPRFLLKGWRTTEHAEDCWVYDAETETISEVRFESLCCELADAEENDLWNAEVEAPAAPIVQSLRRRTAPLPGPPWPVLEELRGLAPGTCAALFHLFWSLRARSPGKPASWDALSSSEYVAVLRNPKPLLSELMAKYRLVAMWVDPAIEPKLALTDWTVFPLQPVGGFAVGCLPIDPQRAILMVDRRIKLHDLQPVLAALPLGSVSHGSPATKVLLPPAGMGDPTQHALAIAQHAEDVLRWRPQLFTWAGQVLFD